LPANPWAGFAPPNEIDPRHCDVVIQRWQQHVGGKAILAGDERHFEDIAVERLLK
jgi:hypothetical protein